MNFIDTIINSDAVEGLKTLPDKSIHCSVTSPPYYGLRDYGVDGQIGLEEAPEEYIERLMKVFNELHRVLRDDGTLWLNIGDSYNGAGKASGDKHIHKYKQATNISSNKCKPTKIHNCKPKDLIGIPWMLAFALRDAGWYLRQDIIWAKPNPMPESVKDRCVKSHEYIFLLSKSKNYYFDYKAIQEYASGYDGRETISNQSQKYNTPCLPGNKILKVPKERWRFKNLSENGQKPNSIHENRLTNKDNLYPVRNKRNVWKIDDSSVLNYLLDHHPEIAWKYISNITNIKSSVFNVTGKPFKGAHFAVFPEDLIVPCIKAGCPEGGIVLDPFVGSGTAPVIAKKLNRHYVGIELNPNYIPIIKHRLHSEIGVFL